MHPCARLAYKDALAYLERWITETILTPAQRARNVGVSLRVIYHLSIARHALADPGNQPTGDDLRVWIGSSAAEAGIELDVRDIAVRNLTPHVT